jgi:hypothetical protein
LTCACDSAEAPRARHAIVTGAADLPPPTMYDEPIDLGSDTPPRAPSSPILRTAGGYRVEGPGFTLWDEDLGALLRRARELGWSGLVGGPAARPPGPRRRSER